MMGIISTFVLSIAFFASSNAYQVDFEGEIYLREGVTAPELCLEGSPDYQRAQLAIKKAILDITGYRVFHIQSEVCDQRTHDDVWVDRRRANVIFPILAAGAFVISWSFVYWKNKELAEKMMNQELNDRKNIMTMGGHRI
mmetsp:Transcript_35149/g.35791  ORF Transcript_35149/g.35791 Transcript_35149/m.35791 type:complete len:140 (+) Transcript_35149:91-510(+)|eukprot:CAMPEP_0182416308 /NCGR_PEP_ID=MMETSP1167-20130531/576_1 /TAXON_ID=2988 /ORGANISM="Mallomonas Sp, Strain CCMP3275" /LENGTH=139 /DNA_ID=CAMNT_0024588957 /DNA_START=85 /DNA_END=504 /DNA_ORIENTATION=+